MTVYILFLVILFLFVFDGLIVLSNNTKEIVQFIEIIQNNICILVSDDVDSIYTLNITDKNITSYELIIMKVKMIEGGLTITEEYNNILIDKDDIGKGEKIIDIICLNKKDIIISLKNLYLLTEYNDNA